MKTNNMYQKDRMPSKQRVACSNHAGIATFKTALGAGFRGFSSSENTKTRFTQFHANSSENQSPIRELFGEWLAVANG